MINPRVVAAESAPRPTSVENAVRSVMSLKDAARRAPAVPLTWVGRKRGAHYMLSAGQYETAAERQFRRRLVLHKMRDVA